MNDLNLGDIKILTIDDIKNKLKNFEDKYCIKSKEFYETYKRDEVDKNIDHFDTLVWSSYYEIIIKEGE